MQVVALLGERAINRLIDEIRGVDYEAWASSFGLCSPSI